MNSLNQFHLSVFKFQQFSVSQEGATMKINTDGVLLAAFCQIPNSVSHILDIGTGTGVIALMLAQRYAAAKVLAVDIDAQTVALAAQNFSTSPFGNRMEAMCVNVMEMNVLNAFDLMISNPPFYTHSLKNPDMRKQQARHTDMDFFEHLFQKTFQMGTIRAEFWLIVPYELAAEIRHIAAQYSWFLHQEIKVYNHTHGKCIRVIFGFGKSKQEMVSLDFEIRNEQNEYSEAYKTLLSSYFL